MSVPGFETIAAFGPVAWYIFVMAATPGPNNAMLAASGMNFGVVRTLPHIFGIVVGLVVLLGASGLGLGLLFQEAPIAKTALAIVGAAYLAYLAWRIANAAAPSAAEGARPLSFWEAFGFQFLNPKGWVMALTAATFAPTFATPLVGTASLALCGALVSWPSMGVWAWFGVGLARLFQRERLRVWVNRALALLLIATIPFMFV